MSPLLPTLVGVDVGTARIKAVALGVEGDELAQADRRTPWRRDGTDVEMEPDELAGVVRSVVRDVVVAAGRERGSAVRVAGLGVAGMAEAGVLVDRRGAPLARIVAWHDPRGDVELLRGEIGVEPFQRAVGMPLDAQPSLAKIAWLRRSEPGVREAVRFLSVPEWAVASLGGSPESELSLACRTGLLDIGERGPFAGATALLGRELLGEVVLAGTPAGRARHDALPHEVRNAVLTVAGHDHQVAALAAGAARPHALFDSMGSAESLVRCVEGALQPAVVGRLVEHGFTVGWGVVAGRSAVAGGLRTGLQLEDVAALLGARDREARRRLAEEAQLLAPSELPARVLPRDEKTSNVLDLLARGVAPAAVWAGAVRDVTTRSTELVARMVAELGPHEDLTLGGGWARNPAVLAEKRRQLGMLTVSMLSEAGATGAALLAGIAAEILERPETDPSPIWSLRAVPRERKAL